MKEQLAVRKKQFEIDQQHSMEKAVSTLRYLDQNLLKRCGSRELQPGSVSFP